MSTPWFFLSYARAGDASVDRHVKEFYEKLVAEMRGMRGEMKGLSEGEIGFIDVKAIKLGADWRWSLAKELWNCRVLVCLFSHGYLTSENCGKEFYAFRSRFPADDPGWLSRRVVPVLWGRPDMLPELPDAVGGIQNWISDLGPEYARRGLYAIKDEGDAGEYNRLVRELAARIIMMGVEAAPTETARLPSAFRTLDATSWGRRIWNAWVNPPLKPGLVEAETIASRQIRVTWRENPAASANSPKIDGFHIERLRHDGRPGFSELREVEPGTLSYTDERVARGTTYRYRVCAYNAGGPSEYEESNDVRTSGMPPPPMPSGLEGSASWLSLVRLKWKDNSEGKGGFKIERCSGRPGAGFKLIGEAGPGVTSYKDLVLRPWFTYLYRVCATDGENDSDYTDEVRVSTIKPLLLLILLLVVGVVAAFASSPGLMCRVVPPLCPTPPTCPPTPTPAATPAPHTDEFSDAFFKGDGTQGKRWQREGEWDVPALWAPAWLPAEMKDDDGWMVAEGAEPGLPKYYFDNFVLSVPIQFEEGSSAGFVLRARGDAASGHTGYCFVLERRGTAFYLVYYWGSPKQRPASARDLRLGMTDFGVKDGQPAPEDFIQVTARAEGDRFHLTFKHDNPVQDERTELPAIPVDLKAGNFALPPCEHHPPSGRVGLFASDKSRFQMGEVVVTPLPAALTPTPTATPD